MCKLPAWWTACPKALHVQMYRQESLCFYLPSNAAMNAPSRWVCLSGNQMHACLDRRGFVTAFLMMSLSLVLYVCSAAFKYMAIVCLLCSLVWWVWVFSWVGAGVNDMCAELLTTLHAKWRNLLLC